MLYTTVTDVQGYKKLKMSKCLFNCKSNGNHLLFDLWIFWWLYILIFDVKPYLKMSCINLWLV